MNYENKDSLLEMSCHVPILLASAATVMSNTLKSQGASLEDTLYKNYNVVIPRSLKIGQSKRAISAIRTKQQIRAENQTYASNNNKQIKIKLPNATLYDTRFGVLRLNIKVSSTGGTYCRLPLGAGLVFDRLRILMGATVIEDIIDYNRCQAMVWKTEVSDEVNASYVSLDNDVGGMGIGTKVQRNAWGANENGTVYDIPLLSGILNGELLPFESIRGGMEIQLYIGDPSTIVETDGTNPLITISAVEFYIEKLELEQTYMDFVNNYIRQYGLQFGFHSWERYSNTLTTGTAQNIMLNVRSSSISGFFNMFVNSAEISSTTVSDKFITWTRRNLSTMNLQINGKMYPDEPLDAVTNGSWEFYQIYLRYCAKWKLNGRVPLPAAMPFSYFNDDSFLFINDMEAYPEEEGLINPFTTLNNNSTTILKLQFDSTIPANWQLDTWVKYFKQVGISTNGEARVIQ